MANNSPHNVADLSKADSELWTTPSNCQQCKVKSVTSQTTLAIVKFWPAFRGSIPPRCISVSVRRELNLSRGGSMTK